MFFKERSLCDSAVSPHERFPSNCLALWFIIAVTCFTLASNWQTPNLKLRQLFSPYGLPRWLSGKESALSSRKLAFDPWVRKMPWRKKWQPSPVFLPGESHGQRSLVGYSPRGHKESDTTSKLHRHYHLALLWDLNILKRTVQTHRVVGCRLQVCNLISVVCLGLYVCVCSLSLCRNSVFSPALCLVCNRYSYVLLHPPQTCQRGGPARLHSALQGQ